MRIPVRVLGAIVGLVGALLVAAPAASGAAGCPSVNGKWADPGPFAVISEQSGDGHTVFRPTDLGTCLHPVILWGNGTWATPANYQKLLEHFASHGFIVAAANTTWAGSGKEMLGGLDWVSAENSRTGSPYFGKVDTAHVGASGHSQGAGGAIAAGADPRVGDTAPIEPGGPWGDVTGLHGPMFILAGQNDKTVSPASVVARYDNAGHIPAIYGELAGANHLTPVGDGGGFRGPVTAWFRYRLMADPQARPEFTGPSCGQCTSTAWSDFRRNARADGWGGRRWTSTEPVRPVDAR
ncbi:acetylxylan esterase [Pseudonocardiaceae bacterium YIM PH 21723]|nr:acetylxylan esterase [Pseudonocardiaceae bacterium YIM PH 21723]